MAEEPAERRDPEGFLTYASDYHAPVLCKTAVERLVKNPDGLYVDGTLGGGGHTSALLDFLSPKGRVISLDRDEEAINWSRKRLANAIAANRFTPLRSNFVEVESALAGIGITHVDGLLLDLGVSSHQVDAADRGFSFRFSADLDMRMDTRQPFTAADVINNYDERRLHKLFEQYGQVTNAKTLAAEVRRFDDEQFPIFAVGGGFFFAREVDVATAFAVGSLPEFVSDLAGEIVLWEASVVGVGERK